MKKKSDCQLEMLSATPGDRGSEATEAPPREGAAQDARAGAGEDRIDLARSRIARDYYNQSHVRNRILKALLEMMDLED
jgi:hypothetical protein